MAKFNVVEIFSSINGEGTRQGQLATFVRMQGCNLQCSYCDTRWANEVDAPVCVMSEQEILDVVLQNGCNNITLTGGEPLLQKDISILLELLTKQPNLRIEIETNGTVPIQPFVAMEHAPAITMDYKLPGSGMEAAMCLENFSYLQKQDTVKFVVGSFDDLYKCRDLIATYQLTEKCHVYISPVFGKIAPDQIVEFMKQEHLNDVNLQLQIHKIIWDSQMRGV